MIRKEGRFSVNKQSKYRIIIKCTFSCTKNMYIQSMKTQYIVLEIIEALNGANLGVNRMTKPFPECPD